MGSMEAAGVGSSQSLPVGCNTVDAQQRHWYAIAAESSSQWVLCRVHEVLVNCFHIACCFGPAPS